MEQKPRKSTRYVQNVISTIVLSCIALAALLFNIFLLVRLVRVDHAKEVAEETAAQFEDAVYIREDEAAAAAEAAFANGRTEEREALREHIESGMSEGRTALSMVRELFPDKVVVSHRGNYVFHDISDRVPAHPFVPESFTLDENLRLQLSAEEQQQEQFGIDVSALQGEIEWDRVAASGVDFVMVRAALRGTATGELTEDSHFTDNIEGAAAAGIRTGVYFYSSAVSVQEAREDAAFLLERLEPYREQITLPVALGLEFSDEEGTRQYDVSQEVMTEVAKTFLTEVEKAGYTPMLYGNVRTFCVMVDITRLAAYPRWIAYYDMPLYFPYDFDYWQYTARGTLPGIEGEVDFNIGVKSGR